MEMVEPLVIRSRSSIIICARIYLHIILFYPHYGDTYYLHCDGVSMNGHAYCLLSYTCTCTCSAICVYIPFKLFSCKPIYSAWRTLIHSFSSAHSFCSIPYMPIRYALCAFSSFQKVLASSMAYVALGCERHPLQCQDHLAAVAHAPSMVYFTLIQAQWQTRCAVFLSMSLCFERHTLHMGH